ncbi:MAG: hypothetical protein GF317_04530 [Candidatus Lokiarchaeota archaeon]|nr:hypothetical protein [Candidatus Lokiarchaeota archaeon]MBD3199156.1 hypothetical protein [Candidatus Lokiarchaeota archaeon]
MDKCIFCGSATSFRYEGNGEYNNKPVCPKCQSEQFKTNFNTGCAGEEDCSKKFKLEEYDK